MVLRILGSTNSPLRWRQVERREGSRRLRLREFRESEIGKQ